MRKRVVITGLGCISPLGNDVSSLWKGIIAGLSGVDHITHYDTREHRTKIAAEVKGFNGEAMFGAREARRMDRFAQFALAAAMQAVAAPVWRSTEANRDQVGVVLGSGIGGVHTLFDNVKVFLERGPYPGQPIHGTDDAPRYRSGHDCHPPGIARSRTWQW